MKHDTVYYPRLARSLALLGCLLLGTACGWVGNPNDAGGKENDMRTLTKDQAAERVQEHIKRAIDALPVESSLSILEDTSVECLDPSDNGPPGRYEVSKTYRLNDIPKERNEEFINTLYQYWEHNNYRILSDHRDRDDMFLSAEHNGDAFDVSVEQSGAGKLALGATSPCVWPDGVPPSSVEE